MKISLAMSKGCWLFSQRPEGRKTRVEHRVVVVATAGVNYRQSFGIALRSNTYGGELREISAW